MPLDDGSKYRYLEKMAGAMSSGAMSFAPQIPEPKISEAPMISAATKQNIRRLVMVHKTSGNAFHKSGPDQLSAQQKLNQPELSPTTGAEGVMSAVVFGYR
jgi:hypothetical protein